MAFILPTAQYLMTSNASVNKGTWSTLFSTGIKASGNLPLTTNATEVQNTSGSKSIWFGLDDQAGVATYDVSTDTKVLLTSFQFNAPNRIQVDTMANAGVKVRLGSSNADYREYLIGGNDTPVASAQSGAVTVCIDLNATSQDSAGGTFDNTALDRWGFGTKKLNLADGSPNQVFFQRVFLFDTTKDAPNIPKFTGAASNWDESFTAVQGSSYTTTLGKWLSKLGDSFFVPCPFQFGDGTTATVFNDNGSGVISPADNDTNSENFRLSNQAMRVYLSQRDNASDSVTLSGAYTWGTPSPWDFNEDNNASCFLSGNFSGMGDFTLGGSVEASGVFTLATGSKVICIGANTDGITVNGDMDIQGFAVTTFTDVNITGSLDFDTAGTYTLDACDINEVTNSSGGSVILNLINGSSITTNTGPNTTLNENKSGSVSNLVAGSRIQIYNVTSDTEIANEIVAGTSYSVDYNEGAEFTTGDTVRVRLAYQSGVTAKGDFETNAIAGASGWSVLANQSDDSVYNSFGLDGSTVTEFTFDSGDIHVDINDTDNVTQIQRLGAWNCYYITTEDGIRNLLGGIEWETTNSIRICTDCVDLKIHNTKVNPLLLEGGRIYRDDNATIIATTSNSIQLDYAPVYTVEGSGGGDATLANQTQILSDIADLETKVDTVDGIVDAILVDTNELQSNQGDWATATTTISSNMRGTDNASTFDSSSDEVTTDIASREASKADVSGLSTFNPSSDEVTTDSVSREASKADVSALGTHADLEIINTGVKKASNLRPHNGDLP